MEQKEERPRKAGRPPRAGAAADAVLRVRLIAEERARLDASAAARGRPVADHVRAWIAGEDVPAPPPDFVTARPRPGVEPDLWSRWTPRRVWTLHLVPGRLDGPPLAVRRRVLRHTAGDLVVETPAGSMVLLAEPIEAQGRGRGRGQCRKDGTGLELALEVYDHDPTAEDRTEWLRRHRVIQAVIRSPQGSVWVSVPGPRPGAPDRAVKIPYLHLQEQGRTERAVFLPSSRGPAAAFVANTAEIDLYDLALDGAAEVCGGDGRRHRISFEAPGTAQLRAEGRDRRPSDYAAPPLLTSPPPAPAPRREPPPAAPHDPREVEFAQHWKVARTPGMPAHFVKEAEKLAGAVAVRIFGLDPATATWAEVRRVWNARALAGHSDRRGSADMGNLTRHKDAARAYLTARDASEP